MWTALVSQRRRQAATFRGCWVFPPQYLVATEDAIVLRHATDHPDSRTKGCLLTTFMGDPGSLATAVNHVCKSRFKTCSSFDVLVFGGSSS